MRGIRFPHMLVSEDPRPVWVCQHQPASSFRDMKIFSFSLTVILNLRVLYLILCSQTANSFFICQRLDRAGPGVNQSTFLSGRLSSATKYCYQQTAAKSWLGLLCL